MTNVLKGGSSVFASILLCFFFFSGGFSEGFGRTGSSGFDSSSIRWTRSIIADISAQTARTRADSHSHDRLHRPDCYAQIENGSKPNIYLWLLETQRKNSAAQKETSFMINKISFSLSDIVMWWKPTAENLFINGIIFFSPVISCSLPKDVAAVVSCAAYARSAAYATHLYLRHSWHISENLQSYKLPRWDLRIFSRGHSSASCGHPGRWTGRSWWRVRTLRPSAHLEFVKFCNDLVLWGQFADKQTCLPVYSFKNACWLLQISFG